MSTAVTAAAPAALRPVRTEPPPARRTARSIPLTLVPARAPGALPARAPGAVPARAPDAPAPAEAAGAPPLPGLRLLRHEPEPDGPDPDEPDPAAPAGLGPPAAPVPDLRETPDLRKRAHRVLCLVLEAIDGRRPLGHVAPHLDPPALRYVRAALTRPHLRPAGRLTSLHVSRPCPGAVEVAAVRRAGRRARAVVARFEGRPDEPDRWRCVLLRLL